MKKVLISLILLGTYLFFGVYPSYHVNGNVNQIILERETPGKPTHIIEINKPEDIRKLVDPIEMLWSSFGSINSWEEFPRYRISLNYEGGEIDTYIFSENEWSSGSSTPTGYIELVEWYIYNKAMKKDAAK